MMMNFSGKVAIVTGGTSGIGRAAAIAYAQVIAQSRLWRMRLAGRLATAGAHRVG